MILYKQYIYTFSHFFFFFFLLAFKRRRMQDGQDDETRSNLSSPLFTPEGSPTRFVKEQEEKNNSIKIALQDAPYISGFYHFTNFLSFEECQEIIDKVIDCHYFNTKEGRDQAVLFGMRNNNENIYKNEKDQERFNGLPNWAQNLLKLIEERMEKKYKGIVKEDTLDILFNPFDHLREIQYTRQMILNVYSPGQGIADHIDLPNRFLDGIMILSFGSGISMNFAPIEKEGEGEEEEKQKPFSLYLQPGSICILTGKSRWQWTHGISAQTYDLIYEKDSDRIHRIERSPRFSITIRWLKIQAESTSLHRELRDDLAQSHLRNNQAY